MIKYIRVTNNNDPVCTFPPLSYGWIPRPFKHVGINVRLYKDKEPIMHHSTTLTFMNVLQNSMFKNPFTALRNHDIELYDIRMQKLQDDFKKITIESLYDKESIVKLNINREKTQLGGELFSFKFGLVIGLVLVFVQLLSSNIYLANST